MGEAITHEAKICSRNFVVRQDHLCLCSLIFLSKFHCELNFIEMLWGYVKAQLR